MAENRHTTLTYTRDDTDNAQGENIPTWKYNTKRRLRELGVNNWLDKARNSDDWRQIVCERVSLAGMRS